MEDADFLEKILTDKDSTLRNLSSIELADSLLYTNIDSSKTGKTILHSIISKNIPEDDLDNLDKYYEYYSKFMKIYFSMVQLAETLPLLEDFYAWAEKNKNAYQSIDDTDYNKALKMVLGYIFERNKTLKGYANDKNDAIDKWTSTFQKISDIAPNALINARKLMETLSICICYNEQNSDWMVNFGRKFHINRRGLSGGKDKMAKAVNKLSKYFTGDKFKIFTYDMLKAVSAEGGLSLPNTTYNHHEITETLMKIQQDYKNEKL